MGRVDDRRGRMSVRLAVVLERSLRASRWGPRGVKWLRDGAVRRAHGRGVHPGVLAVRLRLSEARIRELIRGEKVKAPVEDAEPGEGSAAV